MTINWFAAFTVPSWIASAGFELYHGNIRLAVISLSFAVANAMLATLGGK